MAHPCTFRSFLNGHLLSDTFDQLKRVFYKEGQNGLTMSTCTSLYKQEKNFPLDSMFLKFSLNMTNSHRTVQSDLKMLSYHPCCCNFKIQASMLHFQTGYREKYALYGIL